MAIRYNVVEDLRFSGGLESTLIPSYFLPMAQAGDELGAGIELFVRPRGDADALLPIIRRLVQAAHPGVDRASREKRTTYGAMTECSERGCQNV